MFQLPLTLIFAFAVSHSIQSSYCFQEKLKVTKQVYFDITVRGKEEGRIVFGLFGDLVPKTVDNFFTIATKGIDGRTYAGTIFHRVIKKFMLQGGDILFNNGTGSLSIYGPTFEDENFELLHSEPGLLTMANKGPNSNGAQFYITTAATPWLDNHHVIFGKVLEGQRLVHRLEHTDTDNNDRPKYDIVIKSCGEIPTKQPFYISHGWETFLKASLVPLGMSFTILAIFQWFIQKLKFD